MNSSLSKNTTFWHKTPQRMAQLSRPARGRSAGVCITSRSAPAGSPQPRTWATGQLGQKGRPRDRPPLRGGWEAGSFWNVHKAAARRNLFRRAFVPSKGKEAFSCVLRSGSIFFLPSFLFFFNFFYFLGKLIIKRTHIFPF